MAKVWLKTRYDNEMKIEIPHSNNFAAAMYGFRELGAEIAPYHTIDEIYERVEREDIVLDYIEQCNTIFRKFGVTPSVPDYPDVLRPFLGRKMWTDTIDNISHDEAKWSAGYFVKPIKSKAFTGKIIASVADLVGCGNYSEDYEVLVSESIEILAEWRGFIRYDELLDLRPYGLLLRPKHPGYFYHYDSKVVIRMMEAFQRWEGRPAACSMDICCTSDGRTLLVECNDAYSLGSYGLPNIIYAKFIAARWAQLLGYEDAYR